MLMLVFVYLSWWAYLSCGSPMVNMPLLLCLAVQAVWEVWSNCSFSSDVNKDLSANVQDQDFSPRTRTRTRTSF